MTAARRDDALDMLSASFSVASAIERMKREHADVVRSLVLTLLELHDDVRLIDDAGPQGDATGTERFRLFRKKFDRALEQAGCRPVPAQGLAVDLALHRVVDVVDEPGAPDVVARVFRPGYFWNEELLRAADVLTRRNAMNPEPAARPADPPAARETAP